MYLFDEPLGSFVKLSISCSNQSIAGACVFCREEYGKKSHEQNNFYVSGGVLSIFSEGKVSLILHNRFVIPSWSG